MTITAVCRHVRQRVVIRDGRRVQVCAQCGTTLGSIDDRSRSVVRLASHGGARRKTGPDGHRRELAVSLPVAELKLERGDSESPALSQGVGASSLENAGTYLGHNIRGRA